MKSPFLNQRALFALLVVAAGLAGLFVSFKTTISLLGPDADISLPADIMSGLHAYGWGFLKDYNFAPDNWLLSLVPLHFLVYWIFGPHPEGIVVLGWLFFVGNAVVCGLIARALGAGKTAIFLPLLLLFCGRYAYAPGFASYALSHNGTNLYGLLILLCGVQWIKNRRVGFLALVLLLSIVVGVSDPWLMATYLLPISLTALLALLVFPGGGERRAYAMLLATIALAGWVIKTQCVGLLSFVPSFRFQLAPLSLFPVHAYYFVKCLGGLFFLIPGSRADAFTPCLVSALALLALMLAAVHLLARNKPLERPVAWLAFSAIALSVGGIAAAFILSASVVAEWSGRFLLNWLYLAPLFIAVSLELHWDRASKGFKIASATFAALFVLSGVASNYEILSRPGLAFNNNGIDAFAQFLDANGLNYGYGPYWGCQANAVSNYAQPRIVLRPVRFSKTTGYIYPGGAPTTSKTWYRAEAVPPRQKEYFVVVNNDAQECPDVDLCVAGLTQQFGPPCRTLRYHRSWILVWDHPLLDAYLPVALGTRLPFGINANPLNSPGWGRPKEWGVWSEGKAAQVKLALPSRPEGDLELRIEGCSYVAPRHPIQQMDVFVNGHAIGRLQYDSRETVLKTLRIPSAIASEKEGRLLIEFQMQNPVSLAQLGKSANKELWGLGLVSLQVNSMQPLAQP